MADEQRIRDAVELAVSEVTLLEDRAHVVRRGRLELGEGLQRLIVERVAPVMTDKTLTLDVLSGEAVAVDVRVVRRAVFEMLADADAADDDLDAAAERLRRDLQVARNEAEAVQGVYEAALLRATSLARASSLGLAELAEDVAWGRDELGEWAGRLDDLRDAEIEARVAAHDAEVEAQKKLRAVKRLAARLRAVERPDRSARADLHVDLQVESPGTVEVRVDYIVPNACWRPYHTARLTNDASNEAGAEGPRVEVSTDACVWQNTGEDWNDVELVLSTERASLGVEPPELATDLLAWRRKSEVIAVEARDQTIDTTGISDDEDTVSVTRSASAPELPGIDDGGDPVELRAPQRATIPSDGRPWRVLLDRFEATAEIAWVAYPELSPCVLVKSTQSNEAPRPLLAGPVDLVRDSGFVGRTSVLFVSAGERFELIWGPDPDLRVHRDVDESVEKSRALSNWHTSKRSVTVRLSNLGAESRKLTVTERVPISEIEQVKVKLLARDTTSGASPDENGFVTWPVELSPRGRKKLELAYELRRHESVVGL